MKKILFCTTILLVTGILASCYSEQRKTCTRKEVVSGKPQESLLFFPGIPGIITD